MQLIFSRFPCYNQSTWPTSPLVIDRLQTCNLSIVEQRFVLSFVVICVLRILASRQFTWRFRNAFFVTRRGMRIVDKKISSTWQIYIYL